MTTKTQQYRIERKDALEYVVVRCPKGHREPRPEGR